MHCAAPPRCEHTPSHCALSSGFFHERLPSRQPAIARHPQRWHATQAQPPSAQTKSPCKARARSGKSATAGPACTRPAIQRLLAHRFLGSSRSVGSSVSSRLGSVSSSSASVLGGVSSVVGSVLGRVSSVAGSFLGSSSSVRSSSAGISSSVLGSIGSGVSGVLGGFNGWGWSRCWSFHWRRCWRRHNSFFLLAASSQCNCSDHRCENKGLLHLDIPKDGKFLWKGPGARNPPMAKSA